MVENGNAVYTLIAVTYDNFPVLSDQGFPQKKMEGTEFLHTGEDHGASAERVRPDGGGGGVCWKEALKDIALTLYQ
jgi:hypothetical protein